MPPNLPVELGILAVIAPEIRAVRQALGVTDSDREDKADLNDTVYFRRTIASMRQRREYSFALAAIGSAGTDSAAVATTRMIERYHPRVVLLVGIAAGIRGKVRIGDVVLSERVVAYDRAAQVKDPKTGEHRVEPRPEISPVPHGIGQDLVHYDPDPGRLAAKFAALGGEFPGPPAKRKKDWDKQVASAVTCQAATIASGNKLLRDADKLYALRELHGKVEVAEMELAGVEAACRVAGVPWLAIRGISDFGDDFKDDRFHKFASETAGVVLQDFLEHGLDLGPPVGARAPTAAPPQAAPRKRRTAQSNPEPTPPSVTSSEPKPGAATVGPKPQVSSSAKGARPKVAPVDPSHVTGLPAGTIAVSPRERLCSLMGELFDPKKFRTFLAFFPEVPDLLHELPDNASLKEKILEFVLLAEREGLLHDTFLQLRRTFTRRVGEIEGVWALFPKIPPPSAGVSEAAAKPPAKGRVSPGKARDTGSKKPETPPASQAGPTADEVELEKKLAEVLARGPEALVARLDVHVAARGALPNLTPVARVAKKLVQLGKGAEAAAALLKGGYRASQDLKSTPDFKLSRERVRELAGVWLPWGYVAADRMKVRQRLTVHDPSRGAACDDLELQVIRPEFAEIFAALVDDHPPAYRTERRGSGGPLEPRQLMPLYAITLPPSRSQLDPDAWLQDILDSIARILIGEMRTSRDLWYEAAALQAHANREVRGTDGYLPLYVLIQGEDLKRGFTTSMIEALKRTFPALRIVELMPDPPKGEPPPGFLTLDHQVLPYLKFIFEDSAT